MPSTTAYKKWDIVLVAFPFTDFTSDKRRPAFIVSPDKFNAGQDVTIVFITSQIHAPARIGDYRLKFWKEAGLPKESMVRMKFATIDKSIIWKKIVSIQDEDCVGIENILLSFFLS